MKRKTDMIKNYTFCYIRPKWKDSNYFYLIIWQVKIDKKYNQHTKRGSVGVKSIIEQLNEI